LEILGNSRFSTARFSTGEGHSTTYITEQIASGDQRRMVMFPDGSTRETLNKIQIGESITTLPERSTVRVQRGPDPRFGMLVPVSSTTKTMPSGLSQVETVTRTATLSDPGNPFALQIEVTSRRLNGRLWESTYTSSTRTFTDVSPLGRQTVTVLDALGRVARVERSGINPIQYDYDARGRLKYIQQGDRLTTANYFNTNDGRNGYLQSLIDPALSVTSFVPDAIGRTLLVVDAAQKQTALGWDANGNLTSVTPPGRGAHVLGYTAVDELESYTPPALSSVPQPTTRYLYDLDGNLTEETRPDGTILQHLYDRGRLERTTASVGDVRRVYYGPTETCQGCAPGKLARILGPYGVSLDLSYDGSLKVGERWSGGVNGNVSWAFDSNFRIVGETISGTTSSPQQVVFGYDNDLLLTCASTTTCAPAPINALCLTRHSAHGLITELAQGAIAESWTYNSFGELATQTTMTNGSPLIGFEYNVSPFQRDELGRIVEKHETFAGVTKRVGYQYDIMGRLTNVRTNGTLTEHYEYDSNGNRLVGQTVAGPSNGTYDAQDRLLTYDAYSYTYGANGELQSRTDTSSGSVTEYTYDPFGNLRAVELPDGRLVEYVTDGLHRRFAKKIGGIVTKQWLYRDALNPVAELDAAGNVTARFVYASRPNVPDFMIRNGAIYRLISDQLGSVRLVVNVQNASDVLLRADYSAFGEVTVLAGDSQVVPFGFAGLYDSDTQLVRFGARDYDPMVGRWVSKDPSRFEGGLNLYVYALNDPVNLFDPTGREPQGAGGASSSGEGGSEGVGNEASEGPRENSEIGSCFASCMESLGADIAGDVALMCLPFAPTPKTPWELGKTMGGGSPLTTWASRLSMGAGASNALRRAGAYAAKVTAALFAGARRIGRLPQCCVVPSVRNDIPTNPSPFQREAS
jgi:RHS repeat-associated protein